MIRVHHALALILTAGCGHSKPEPAPAPVVEPPPPAIRTVVDTVVVRDTSMARQVRALETKLGEKDAQIAALDGQLEAAQQEVARLLKSSQGNRAEATAAIAEAEVAVRSARGVPGSEVALARRMLKKATEVFADSNYAGAAYYARQAKDRVQSSRRPATGGTAPKPKDKPRTP